MSDDKNKNMNTADDPWKGTIWAKDMDQTAPHVRRAMCGAKLPAVEEKQEEEEESGPVPALACPFCATVLLDGTQCDCTKYDVSS